MATRRANDLMRRASRVRLVLMDVDGVLTDGRLFYLPDGNGGAAETKGFDSQDGIGMRWLQDIGGIPLGWISGRESLATTERARILGVRYLYQNRLEKLGPFGEVLADAKVTEDQVAYIGDDFTDLVIMARVGLPIAPANARVEVKKAARLVTKAPGGHGAVREAIEVILRAQNKWTDVLRKYGLAKGAGPAIDLDKLRHGA